ncbi:MAG: hypothetical protein M3Z20_02585 [Chloroflexota bacterium]|nr:hypothetical protein [Chloroflexota bacterium]
MTSRTLPTPWSRLLRDVVIALALLFVTWQCWQQAQRHAPAFQMAEVHVLTGEIAGYTTVKSPERAPSPNINTDVLRPRSAFWLRGQPANLLFYLPGSPWRMANDVPVGSMVRLELTDDPAARAAQAKQYPGATFAQPLVGLAIGDDTVLSARDTVARAEAAQHRWRWGAAVAGVAALGWIGWLVRKWRLNSMWGFAE